MCTVTYIPQPKHGFILSSNRDETAARSPQNLTTIEQDGLQLLFPRDTAAGGTWIAVANDGRVGCVLNGAFIKHKHKPPYRRSRGLMVLDYFTCLDAEDFEAHYDFEGMEPFTFIIVDRKGLFELRWDEQDTHFRRLDPEGCHIWSSATLYPDEVQAMRRRWFMDWLENREDFSLEAIQHFHHHGGEKDLWNGFVMNRNQIVQTVSVSHVVKSTDQIQLIYNDLIRAAVKDETLPLKRSMLV